MEVSHSFGSWGAESEAILRRIYPVHRACRDGDTETLALLIANGQHSGIYQEDQFYGWTPAHWAAYFGKLECLCNLVSHGVNIDIATKRFNQTPTHIASFAVQPHCLLWLIKAGADINRQDYLGETAVHKAARSGTVECLGLLQAQGAYLRAPNNNGHTPSQLAISCGNQHCALYIEQCSPKEITHNGFHHNGHQSNGFHPCNGVNKLPQFISRKRALEEEEPCLFKKSRTDDSRIGDIHDVAMTSAEPAEYTKCCSTSSTPSLGVKRHITSMPQALGGHFM
ncbi:ankyrin repeat domain-containing protein 10-like isoform X2 [Glandiceps talaboti]